MFPTRAGDVIQARSNVIDIFLFLVVFPKELEHIISWMSYANTRRSLDDKRTVETLARDWCFSAALVLPYVVLFVTRWKHSKCSIVRLMLLCLPTERLRLLATEATEEHVTFTFFALHLSLSARSWQTWLKKDSFNSRMKFCFICAWASGVVQSP